MVCVECGEVLEVKHTCYRDPEPDGIDLRRLAYALEAADPDDDGNLSGDPSDYFMRKAKHLRALYRTVRS